MWSPLDGVEGGVPGNLALIKSHCVLFSINSNKVPFVYQRVWGWLKKPNAITEETSMCVYVAFRWAETYLGFYFIFRHNC